jgi:hypothetical protein
MGHAGRPLQKIFDCRFGYTSEAPATNLNLIDDYFNSPLQLY